MGRTIVRAAAAAVARSVRAVTALVHAVLATHGRTIVRASHVGRTLVSVLVGVALHRVSAPAAGAALLAPHVVSIMVLFVLVARTVLVAAVVRTLAAVVAFLSVVVSVVVSVV